jgi:hypothetical protein
MQLLRTRIAAGLAVLPLLFPSAAAQGLFEGGPVPTITLRLEEAALQALRDDARKYVKARVEVEGGPSFTDVAVKLKGAAGSFRGVDDRPAFTLNLDKHVKGQKYHGLDKFHLNNSVQDESLMNERIAAHLFRQAGIPAPRVAHARVRFNDRDLGVYVLKEGFDTAFLKRHFKDHRGNLYDGGFLREIDQPLELDEGPGGEERADLKALVEACRTENAEERWAKVAERLDVEAFLTFMALEFMTCHWDGYCHNRNNYRVYFDPGKGGRAVFLPHGLDQLFGDANFPLLHVPPSLVGSTVMQNPAWRSRYRERVRELLPLFDPPFGLEQVVAETTERLRPVFEGLGPDAAPQHAQRARDTVSRIHARVQSLRRLAAEPEPTPLAFDAAGQGRPEGWYTQTQDGQPRLEAVAPTGEPSQLWIAAEQGRAIASWRAKVRLDPGHYVLRGRARGEGIRALSEGPGTGAGLRISGAAREQQLESGKGWQELAFAFHVDHSREVELVAELRAEGGQVWYDRDSLRLERGQP